MEARMMPDESKSAFHSVGDVTAGYDARRISLSAAGGQAQSSKKDAPPGWKPLSLSIPILSAVVALSLLLAAAIETLAQRSIANGGLALSPTLDDVPQYAMFSYLYVPTIIAVLYSLIWSWIDLDAKRMQPWFELSKKDGVTAENSLFLDYPYDFVATVPFKAARKRHWQVFFAGTTMVIVFWLLTPLQSAILATGIVTQTKTVEVGTRSQLIPLAEQERLMDLEALIDGYSVSWLRQPLPPFTTSNYAVLPFYPKEDPAPAKAETNWTATTTKLSTELNCWPAEVSLSGTANHSVYDFLNGQGCNVTMKFAASPGILMTYNGYWSSDNSHQNLEGPACPKTENSTHQFLAVWAKVVAGQWQDPEPEYDVTGLFCQPSYYKQTVTTQVRASDLRPNGEVLAVLSPKELLTEEEFNSTAFEFLLSNGVPFRKISRDHPFNNTVEQLPRLSKRNLTRPISNLVGYALADQDRSTDDFSDPVLLHQIYDTAHQRLFSTVVDMLFVNTTEFSNHTATSTFPLSGIIVSRPFSIVVETLLCLVACFTVIILWSCKKATCHLTTNPSSISRLVDLIRHNPQLLEPFGLLDNADQETLFNHFKNKRFRLAYNQQLRQSELYMDDTFERNVSAVDEEKPPIQKGYYDPVRPFALRRVAGVGFVAIIVAAIIVLSYFKTTETSQNGLIRPTDNHIVLQLIENYIPTAFATFVEPFWVLLNRLLCVLQPFKDLWAGKTKSANSLDATYTSIPPQLAFFRAIKSRHFTLMSVCSVALLANVLAVGMGALFNEEQTNAAYPANFAPIISTQFDGNNVSTFGLYLSRMLINTQQYQDHWYVTLANATSGTSLPPWTSSEFYFQPHNLSTIGGNDAANTYTLSVPGFGARANCTTTSAINFPANLPSNDVSASDPTACVDPIQMASTFMEQSIQGVPPGRWAVEYVNPVTAARQGNAPCLKTFVMAWGRTEVEERRNASLTASFAVCRPVFETAMFNITVDKSGYVLSYNKLTDFETTSDDPEYIDVLDHLLMETNRQIAQSGVKWHQDTLSRDWVNHVLAVTTKERSFLDPSNPPPDPDKYMPVFEPIYRTAFATLLALNSQLFKPVTSEEPVTGTRSIKETRIFMDQPSFIMSMTVLAMNVVVAVVFYTRAVVFELPRMPTSIGSLIAYVAPSRIVNFRTAAMPGQQSRTFSFGRYVGHNGEVHLGIEMDPHVVRIEASSLKTQKSLLDRLRWGKTDEKHAPVRRGTWV